MKCISKILIALVVLVSFSCKKDEPSQTKDCNCNRVVSHTKYNIPPNQSYGEYVTINDCSGVQTNGNWNTNWGDSEPVNGECL